MQGQIEKVGTDGSLSRYDALLHRFYEAAALAIHNHVVRYPKFIIGGHVGTEVEAC